MRVLTVTVSVLRVEKLWVLACCGSRPRGLAQLALFCCGERAFSPDADASASLLTLVSFISYIVIAIGQKLAISY